MENALNSTMNNGFHLLAFSTSGEYSWTIFFGLSLMYLMCVTLNITIIVLVCLAHQLHTPMYFFLCNLAAQDIIFVSAVLPKLMAITLTGDPRISFHGCIIQVFTFAVCVDLDFLLLATMGYDRYVAICMPLRYHLIMNTRLCVLLMVTLWAFCAANGLCFSLLLSHVRFCKSHDLNFFFCDIKIMLGISCGDITPIVKLVSFEAMFIGFLPFALTVSSYIRITLTMLRIKTSAARLKIFSSCSSHLTVVLLFCGTSLSLYMKSDSGDSGEQNKLLGLIYVGLVPMVNPVVYSLRNRQIRSATKTVYAQFMAKKVLL
ncbi:hypothetical protein GDO86_020649 [Hymenochirus boettgeri]|uniref:Olfactory receptor n=2 Tax=Hymenochirus boettgeri TaxID=247094 RepID=A0A8T2IBW3_9PIPI|nr:hypothetical protein GDO86_020649 [Hymenochirus boettgeri]